MRRMMIVLAALGMVGIGGIPAVGAAAGFADPSFAQTWSAAESKVPNFWGPLATARDGQREQYKEAPGGQRLVQYFDKARMEQAASGVTTGLLTIELKTGKMQVGDATFETRAPAKVNIAGDFGTDGPTYAELSQLPEKTPRYDYEVAFSFYRKDVGFFGGCICFPPPLDLQGGAVPYVEDPGGRFGQYIYKPMMDYIDALPLPMDQTTGYPISPPFYAQVKIAGKATWILAQAFERRVLTFNPDNPAPFRIEFGNIGQHYYQWRYGNIAAPAKNISGNKLAVTVLDEAPQAGRDEWVLAKFTRDGLPVAGATLVATFHLKSGDVTCDGGIPSREDGIMACSRSSTRADIGYRVVVDFAVTYQGQRYTASASFTPRI